MAKKLTYFDLAENDYKFLEEDYRSGRVGNILCNVAQSISERYLKHLIDTYCLDINTTVILHTHSLKNLKRFLKDELPSFTCDWSTAMKADGYYFTTRYPGDDFFLVDADDVLDCWQSVVEVRRAVKAFINSNKVNKNQNVAELLQKVNYFDEELTL